MSDYYKTEVKKVVLRP